MTLLEAVWYVLFFLFAFLVGVLVDKLWTMDTLLHWEATLMQYQNSTQEDCVLWKHEVYQVSGGDEDEVSAAIKNASQPLGVQGRRHFSVGAYLPNFCLYSLVFFFVITHVQEVRGGVAQLRAGSGTTEKPPFTKK